MNTKLYQLELNQKLVNCGMSYIFHLKDDRFFIIDGGYFTPGEEDRLYSFLCERSQAEKPVIAGWFFSHAHQDHVGAFLLFAKKYLQNVVLENLYYNFQPIDLSLADDDWQRKRNDVATVKEFYRTMENECKEIPVTILRRGDRFEMGELKISVLYSQEQLYPEKASFNDYSTVIMIEVEEQKILFLGDAHVKASAILLEHPLELVCDIVQVAHHGFNGATQEIYKATKAKTALWPTPDFEMEANKDRAVNDAILNQLGFEEHYIGGEGTVEITFPYSLGEAKRFPKEFFEITSD